MRKPFQFLLFTLLFLALPLSVNAKPLDEVKQYVAEYYKGELKGDLHKATTINEVIGLLDPYSAYFTAKEMKEFEDAINMNSTGLGIIIEKHDKGIYIAKVLKGGSASKAGIVAGDIITHVDGVSLLPLTVNEASSRITGPENTKVTLTLIKQDGKTQTQTLVRTTFSVPNIDAALLYGNIGYIALYSYSQDAVSLVREEIKTLTKQGATSFIFDLRDNGGGYVESAEQIIGLFPQAHNAYLLADNEGQFLIRAQRQTIQFPADTFVLINGLSASASEMTAAALKDQSAATLYGKTTYGKGTMQAFIPLSDGSYLKLTVAEFFGPKGTKIQAKGVTPHRETATALVTAHYDAITAKYKNYRQTAALKNVPTTKTFTITLNEDVKSISENTIALVTLGGQKVEVTTNITGNKVIVTPKQALKAKGEYVLLVHPQMRGANSRLKKGTSTYITVQ